MKNSLLMLVILASLSVVSCWPFDMYEGKRALSGTYDCTSDRIELRAKSQQTPIMIKSLMSNVQMPGLTHEGTIELRRILKSVCTEANTTNTNATKRDPGFTNISYSYDAAMPRGSHSRLFLMPNVLGRFEKKASSRKVKFTIFEMDPGDDAAEVREFVANKFKEQPCDQTSRRCVACRKSPGSYRWYCSIPND